MALLIGALLLGFFAARLPWLPPRLRKGVPVLGSLSLFVLLFALGLSLGSSPELISALPTLGFRAVLLSAGTVLGSVFLVWLTVKLGRQRG